MRCGCAFSAWIQIVNAVGRGVEKSNGQDSQSARVSEGPGAENERRGERRAAQGCGVAKAPLDKSGALATGPRLRLKPSDSMAARGRGHATLLRPCNPGATGVTRGYPETWIYRG